MEFHPLAEIFPMMRAEEYDALKTDIAKHGLREPITLAEDKIADGRNRYNACVELSIEPRHEEWDGVGSLLSFIISKNLHRRHLSESQRDMIAAKLATLDVGEKSLNLDSLTAKDAADLLNVSRAGVFQAKKVLSEGIPELAEAVERGRVAVSVAAKVAEWEEDEQDDFLDRVMEGTASPRALRAMQQEQQRQEAQQTLENIVRGFPVMSGYRAVVIDPPWPRQKILRDVRPKQDVWDYPTMTVEEIANLPISDLANEAGCHVYLWFTHKHLPDALWLFEEWGVKYECQMTWIKNVGFTPFSWMYSTEHVLFGRIGSLPVQKKGLRLDFKGKVREHSRKPDEFYDRVLQASPAPRIELFSRETREGFDQWGKEKDKFNEK